MAALTASSCSVCYCKCKCFLNFFFRLLMVGVWKHDWFLCVDFVAWNFTDWFIDFNEFFVNSLWFSIYSIFFFFFFLNFGYTRSSFQFTGSLVSACRLLNCGMRGGSSSLTRDWTGAPCIGSPESYLLDLPGKSPIYRILSSKYSLHLPFQFGCLLFLFVA